RAARAVAGGAVGDEACAAGLLLGGLDYGVGNFAVLAADAAALGEGDFGIDIGEVRGDDVFNAGPGGGLFAGFGEEDDIAIEFGVGALQKDHGHHGGREVGLVIERAASVDVAAVACAAEWGEGPLGGVDFNRVAVADDEQGAPGATALEPGDDVGARGIFGGDDIGDAFGVEDLADVIDDAGFVAGRVGGIDLDERLEVVHGFRVDLGPIGSLRGGGEKCDEKEGRSGSHYQSVACPGRGGTRAPLTRPATRANSPPPSLLSGLA